MLKKQKNALFQLMQSSFVNVDDFDFSTEKSQHFEYAKIQLKKTGYFFSIRNPVNNSRQFEYNYVKVAALPTETGFQRKKDRSYLSFEELHEVFNNWLQEEIKRYYDELHTPDLWQEYLDHRSVISLDTVGYDERYYFNREEREQIKFAVRDIRVLIIRKYSPSLDIGKAIGDRLNYLIESSDRLNSFDWKSVLIMTILNISFMLELDQLKGKELFRLFSKIFHMIPRILNERRRQMGLP
jgi:hypothetical protein